MHDGHTCPDDGRAAEEVDPFLLTKRGEGTAGHGEKWFLSWGAEVCGEIFGKFICVGSYSIRSQFAVASGVDDKDFPPYFLKKEFFINLFL